MQTGNVLAALLLGAALSPMPAVAGEVTIKRDQWGMPHVYGDTVHDLFFGYGYAVAQDRLYSMDMARRSASRHVAAALGSEFVDYDRKIRSEYWPASIQQQIDAAAPQEREILAGYAAGMNAWIDKVRAAPDRLMPQEYTVNGFEPEHLPRDGKP